ncbi:major facilitator superfamily domain-containing protein [Phaeosphaeriaceae sp. PMI808]|nr:major facilitator superfamily domain-containing protein [Phaeosphaeriaceae sp. PMI808]
MAAPDDDNGGKQIAEHEKQTLNGHGHDYDSSSPVSTSPPRDWHFWILLSALCASGFVVTMDGTIVVTAISTIATALDTKQYTWIVNSYTLASTVLQPLTGQLAEIFGRLPVLLGGVMLLAIGSAIAGAAPSYAALIVGRTIQGIGGGAVPLVAEIIISDLVPLQERPKFIGLVMATSSLGLILGPVIGGAILNGTTWRWVFYINIPIVGAGILFLIPLAGTIKRLTHTPTAVSWREKLNQIDYIGNFLFSASAIAILLPLTFGGHMFAWSSWRVIFPLVMGVVGLVVFALHERFTIGKSVPLVPSRLLNTPVLVALQAVLQKSHFDAGIALLPTIIAMMFFAIFGGGIASSLKQKDMAIMLHVIAFICMAIGLGCFTMLKHSSSLAMHVILQIVVAMGNGLLLSTLLPAMQAQLPESDIWAITTLFNFLRSFALVWGVTVPSIIFDQTVNEHVTSVPDQSIQQSFVGGGAYARANREFIVTLSESIKGPVLALYERALRPTWWAATAFALLGLVMVVFEIWPRRRPHIETVP